MKRTLLLAAFALATLTAHPQQPRQFSPEAFRAQQEAHITRSAKLTKAEADKLLPLFREMKDKQRKLAQQAQALKRNHPPQSAKDKDYAAAVMQIAKLSQQSAKVQEEYYQRMCKAASPKKVYALILADEDFNRRMVRQFNEHGQKPRK